MTLDQLEIMDLIAKTGSFKAAAHLLHRTQPTLSIAIKKLEAEFNLKLFDRDAYRPSLTEQGRIFLHWAKPCLEAFRKLKVIGHELGNQKIEVELVIGIDPLVRWESLQNLLATCLKDQASTELVLRSVILDEGVTAVLAGSLDFAIAPQKVEHQDIESIFLERVRLIPVMAKGLLPSTDEQKSKSAWLRERPQIIVESTGSSSRGTSGLGLLPGGKRCFVSDHAMKRELILKGYGWGRLAAHEVSMELATGELSLIECDEVRFEDLDLFALRNRNRALGPIARQFWGSLSALGGL